MKNKVIEQISKQIEELIEETYKDGVKAGQEKALTANSENVEIADISEALRYRTMN